MSDEKFLHHWETLKPLLLAKWNKLQEKDLKNIQPLVSQLAGVIHRHYPDMPRANIEKDIINLDDQILKNT